MLLLARPAVTTTTTTAASGGGRCSSALQWPPAGCGCRAPKTWPLYLLRTAPCRLVSGNSHPRSAQRIDIGSVAPGTSGTWAAKRPLRKKPSDKSAPPPVVAASASRPKPAGSKPDVYSVVAYATAEEYNLQFLADDLVKQGLYELHQLPTDVPDVLYASSAYAISAEPRELFVFREGTVVFWNMEQAEIEAFLQLVRRHELDSYDRQLVMTEQEEMDYSYHEGATRLVQDELLLCRKLSASADDGRGGAVTAGTTGEVPAAPNEEEEVDSLALQKYSVANALSLSVKLSIWEASLNRYVDSIEFVTEDLKSGNKLRMSRRDVLRKTGELFALRHLINLSSDLLDTPDFYWDRERLERLYLQTCAYLNINRRTKVMNEKLSHCCDLTGLLREHLNHNHSARLEWMIIVLIMIEIIFEVIHYVDK